MAHPTVSNFKTKLIGAGARHNLFQINLSIAQNALTAAKGFVNQPEHEFWVKAGQVPSSTESILPINHGGRIIKFPGLRTFDDWTCTVINDDDGVIHHTLLNWMIELSGGFSGKRTNTPDASEYVDKQDTPDGQVINKTPSIIPPKTLGSASVTNTRDISIQQFDQQGKETQKYILINAWPNNIAEIPLDWATDGIQEFTVTFSYDYWTHSATQPKEITTKSGTTTEVPDVSSLGLESSPHILKTLAS